MELVVPSFEVIDALDDVRALVEVMSGGGKIALDELGDRMLSAGDGEDMSASVSGAGKWSAGDDMDVAEDESGDAESCTSDASLANASDDSRGIAAFAVVVAGADVSARSAVASSSASSRFSGSV